MKYKAIIFDLDGTLTDTLEDLYLSTNHALRSCELPERGIDEVRRFVGNGVRKLIERAVPEGTEPRMTERCFEAFKAHYVIHCQDHTSLYPGIASLLTALHAKGYRMAVVSNKLQKGVTELANTFFHGVINVAIGEQPGIHANQLPIWYMLLWTPWGSLLPKLSMWAIRMWTSKRQATQGCLASRSSGDSAAAISSLLRVPP